MNSVWSNDLSLIYQIPGLQKKGVETLSLWHRLNFFTQKIPLNLCFIKKNPLNLCFIKKIP